jgi:hypothetical protein
MRIRWSAKEKVIMENQSKSKSEESNPPALGRASGEAGENPT